MVLKKKVGPGARSVKVREGVLLHLHSQEKNKFTNLGLGNVHPRLPKVTSPTPSSSACSRTPPRRARSTSPPTSTRACSNSPSGASSTTPPPAARSRTPSQSLLSNYPHQAKKMKQVDEGSSDNEHVEGLVQDQENTERESSTVHKFSRVPSPRSQARIQGGGRLAPEHASLQRRRRNSHPGGRRRSTYTI